MAVAFQMCSTECHYIRRMVFSLMASVHPSIFKLLIQDRQAVSLEAIPGSPGPEAEEPEQDSSPLKGKHYWKFREGTLTKLSLDCERQQRA